MAKGRHKKWQQNRNKSRGEAGLTYCHLCGIKAEDNATFETVHLEERRHKYNYLLALFKERRSVCCKIVQYCLSIHLYNRHK
jgi:hypothetical protein